MPLLSGARCPGLPGGPADHAHQGAKCTAPSRPRRLARTRAQQSPTQRMQHPMQKSRSTPASSAVGARAMFIATLCLQHFPAPTLVGLVDQDLHRGQVSLGRGGRRLEAVQRHEHLQGRAGAGSACCRVRPRVRGMRQSPRCALPLAQTVCGRGTAAQLLVPPRSLSARMPPSPGVCGYRAGIAGV